MCITTSAEPLSKQDLISCTLLAHVPLLEGSLCSPCPLVLWSLLLPLHQLLSLLSSSQLGFNTTNSLALFFFWLYPSGKTPVIDETKCIQYYKIKILIMNLKYYTYSLYSGCFTHQSPLVPPCTGIIMFSGTTELSCALINLATSIAHSSNIISPQSQMLTPLLTFWRMTEHPPSQRKIEATR